MRRALNHLLIGLALLVTQQGAQVHVLSHLGHDVAAAQRGEKNAPPVGHSAEKCIAFHALGSALPSGAFAFEPPRTEQPAVAHLGLSFLSSPRIAFDSRAPPAFS